MHQLSFALIRLALVICWAATLMGFLARWWPAEDLVNHFRPFAAAGAAVLLCLALTVGSRTLAIGSTAMLSINLALLLTALLLQAPRLTTGQSLLKVATLNTWTEKGQADRIIHFVEQTQADVFLLQEIEAADRAEVLPQLRSVYPHIFFDERTRRSPAILSKKPWLLAGVVPGATDHPVAVWVGFEQGGHEFEIASVHTANPFEDVDRLIAFARSRRGPLILGEDFNLTPYLWKLTKLAHRAGLRPSAQAGLLKN